MRDETTGSKLVSDTRAEVIESTGYRSEFADAMRPKVSRFVKTLEEKLKSVGATLRETSDPEHDVAYRRRLPRGDWPYSIWECPDASIVAVFEARAEVAQNEGDLIRYAQQRGSNLAGTMRYAGQWDGEDVNDLAQALHTAAARVLGGDHDIRMDEVMVFGMMEIPHSDRLSDDHPYHELGILHGMDTHGRVLLSTEDTGPLFVTPTNSDELKEVRVKAEQAAERAAKSPLGKHFKAHHDRVAQFYARAAQAMTDAPALTQSKSDSMSM